MFKICGTTISLTRGDTLGAVVNILEKLSDGTTQPYVPAEGDTVSFALKDARMKRRADGYMEFKDPECLITKEIPTDTLILELDPEDTQTLGFGAYVYDIRLTHADGRVDTFIHDGVFNLCVEVHDD